MIDFLAWWDQYMAWIQTATTLAFFGLLVIALLAWLLGSKGKAFGCIATDLFLLFIAVYLYDTFGLEIFMPEVFELFDGGLNPFK